MGEQLENLLERQGTDYADFLVLGDLMAPVADYGHFLEEIGEVLAAGTAKAWAVNNWSAAEVAALSGQARAAGVPGPDFAQLKYGLVRRSIAEGEPYRRLAEEVGVRIQASDTFEGGLIFGPRTHGAPRMIGGNVGSIHAAVRAHADAIAGAAEQLGTSPAALAIAVPLLNPNTANVLIGARTPGQLQDALGVYDLLARHDAHVILEVAGRFWFDEGIVSPEASWGAVVDDDAAGYDVEER